MLTAFTIILILWTVFGAIAFCINALTEEMDYFTWTTKGPEWDKWNIYQRLVAVAISGPVVWIGFLTVSVVKTVLSGFNNYWDYLGTLSDIKSIKFKIEKK